MKDRMLIRSYTPTKPLLPNTESKSKSNSEGKDKDGGKDKEGAMRDGTGTFELTVKTYFPTEDQPGGAMSNLLDCMPLGEEVEVRGPTGEIEYNGHGRFVISGKEYNFSRVNLVLGGSGVTPGYALVARAMLDEKDGTEIRVVDANKSEGDILLKDELEEFDRGSAGRLRVTHILSHPGETWEGRKGHVDGELMKEVLFEPGKGTGVFLCGPPGMIQKAVVPVLREWGFREGEDVFGF